MLIRFTFTLALTLSIPGSLEANTLRWLTPESGIGRSAVVTSVDHVSILLGSGVYPRSSSLVAIIRLDSGETTQLRASIEEPLGLSEEHHMKFLMDPEDGYWGLCYRALYGSGGRFYIIGHRQDVTDFDGDTATMDSSLSIERGFDVKSMKFWYKIDINKTPVLPVRFKGREWRGVRFLIPARLEDFEREEAALLIERRGGQVVDATGPADVLLLPDRLEFCPGTLRSGHKVAAKWIRDGARVLWERDFPRPGRGDSSDIEYLDDDPPGL